VKLDPELRDGLFWQFMEDLSACLCAELEAAKGPELCFCGVIPGDAVDTSLASLGTCKGGMAWVRMVTSYASTTFPQQDELAGCATLLAATFEVGVLRPAVLGTDRRPPTVADLVAETRLQFSDQSAMHRAIACCANSSSFDFVYALGDYTPDGPDGSLVGGSWTVTIQQEF
jgi:hypothetical protein